MLAQTVILTAAVAVIGSNSLVLSPILADVAAGLGTTVVAVSRAIAAYGGATALSAFLLAPRIDRVGPRRALVGGMACLVAATLLSAAAPHWPVLLLAQALAGLGAGVALPSIYALATAIAPPGRESAVLGRVLAGWSVSLVAGVPASALIADLAGWRAPFLVLAALAALALLGAARLPAARLPTGGGAETSGGRSRPLAPLSYPNVPALLAVCLVFMAAFYGVYAFVGDHVRTALGVSAGGAGLLVLAYGLGFGGASLGDRLIDRAGPGRALPRALLAVAAVYALLAPATASFPTVVALAGLWGTANHFGLNALILLLSRARPDQRGAVLGLNSAVTYLGALLGTAAAGMLYPRAGFAALSFTAAALVAGAAVLARASVGSGPVARAAATAQSSAR
jgi:predicted MFS family arabinose efflux permease